MARPLVVVKLLWRCGPLATRALRSAPRRTATGARGGRRRRRRGCARGRTRGLPKWSERHVRCAHTCPGSGLGLTLGWGWHAKAARHAPRVRRAARLFGLRVGVGARGGPARTPRAPLAGWRCRGGAQARKRAARTAHLAHLVRVRVKPHLTPTYPGLAWPNLAWPGLAPTLTLTSPTHEAARGAASAAVAGASPRRESARGGGARARPCRCAAARAAWRKGDA